MFFALLAALTAAAPVATPAPAPSTKAAPTNPATVAEAMRLLDEQGFEEEAISSADMTLELVLAAMTEQIQKRTNEPVPADFLEQLKNTMREHQHSTLRASMSAMKQQAAAIYAQEFTQEELIRLRELSRDPVMQKSRERMKVIAPKLMALGAVTARATQPELEAKIQRLVSDYLAKQSKGSDRS